MSDNAKDFVNFAVNILDQDLTPLLHMVTTSSFFMGLIFVMIGLSRLHRHGQGHQMMMQRVHPMGTGMYFLSGVVLISFIPELQMLSDSLFNSNTVLMHQCLLGADSGVSGVAPTPIFHNGVNPIIPLNPANGVFNTDSQNFCPMEAYADDIQQSTSGDITEIAIKYLAFGTLMLVGIISFVRGMVHLVKIGEGQHGQGGVGRALTHIFAGVAASNADNLYALANNILNANVGSISGAS